MRPCKEHYIYSLQSLTAIQKYVLKLDLSQLVSAPIIQSENKTRTSRLSFASTKQVKVNQMMHYVPMNFPTREKVQLTTDINFAFLDYDFSLHELRL